jgi:hypothetical protein
VALELDRAVGNLPREGKPAAIGRDFRRDAAAAGEPASGRAAAFAGGDVDGLAGLELEPAKLMAPEIGDLVSTVIATW